MLRQTVAHAGKSLVHWWKQAWGKSMQLRLAGRAALVAVAGLAIGSVALAQGSKTPPPNWSQTVTKEQGGNGQEFDAKQIDLIQKVSSYFNQMGDVKGTFVQINADNKRLRGKFYFKRPGRFRFEYSLPSRQVVVSDGKYMAVQDHDLMTDDRYGLDQTPFRVLLRKDVDLLNDAKILEVGETDDRIVLGLQDKSPDTVGRIKLFLLKKQPYELREWVTTDAQGLDTRVELTELQKVDDLDANLFVPPPIALQKLQQR
jgi:outer membrane lipoprotein-sorting protein